VLLRVQKHLGKHFTSTHGFFPTEAIEEFTENRWKSLVPRAKSKKKVSFFQKLVQNNVKWAQKRKRLL